jgi:hypothetical protein
VNHQPTDNPSDRVRPAGPPDRTPAKPVAERRPTEAEIDKAVADTFPASDPVSLHLEQTPPARPGRDAPRPD